MFLLPKGNPLFENLAATKLKLPEVMTKAELRRFYRLRQLCLPDINDHTRV